MINSGIIVKQIISPEYYSTIRSDVAHEYLLVWKMFMINSVIEINPEAKKNTMILFMFKMIIYLSSLYLPIYPPTYLKKAEIIFIMILILVTIGWYFFFIFFIIHCILLLNIIILSFHKIRVNDILRWRYVHTFSLLCKVWQRFNIFLIK